MKSQFYIIETSLNVNNIMTFNRRIRSQVNCAQFLAINLDTNYKCTTVL